MELVDGLVGLAILLGLVGVVVPVLPGTLLVAASVLVWALVVGEARAWGWAAGAMTLLALGAVAKYAVPGRRLKTQGVPASSLLAGGLLGLVGFFVVPVVGLVLGFVGGVYLAEARRLDARDAWTSTVASLRAVGLALLIELAAGLLAASVWLAGALST